MTRRPDRRWEEATTAPPDHSVAGSDADLARVLARHPGALVAFSPDISSDLARSLGLPPGEVSATRAEDHRAVPLDLIHVRGRGVAVNAVVVGIEPAQIRWWHRRVPVILELGGRVVYQGMATSVVVANGEFVGGADLVPRAHPGDGWLDVQLYDVDRAERAELRRRAVAGRHVPHPRILQRKARVVRLRAGRALPLVLDGRRAGRIEVLEAELVPGIARVLV